MANACLRSKFGFCKFGRRCDKTHFTEVCDDQYCRGNNCDKRHPVVCFFFRVYGRCKFGTFCEYGHPMKKEQKLEDDVKALKLEVSDLKNKVDVLLKKLTEIETLKTDKIEKSDDKLENTKVQNESAEKREKYDGRAESKIDWANWRSLDEIIRENSEKFGKVTVMCDHCDYETSSDDNMKIHKAKEHTNVKLNRGYLCGTVRKEEGGGRKCNICDLRLPKFEEMENHQRQEHGYLGEKVIKNGFV